MLTVLDVPELLKIVILTPNPESFTSPAIHDAPHVSFSPPRVTVVSVVKNA